MTDTLPARILLQIREGVPNEILSLDLPVHETQPLDASDPDAIAGANLAHTVDARDIIGALAQAQRREIQKLRDQGGFEASENWLRKLQKWVLA